LNQRRLNRDPPDGRLMMGVAGLLFIPIASAGVYSLLYVLQRPQGPVEWGIRILLDQLAISALLFFTVGFLWAISGNRRLKKLLDTVAIKLAWILIPLAIPAFGMAAWVAIFG
jgi:hypothetical protein